MDPLGIIELQRWGFPGVTKCRHRSIEFLTTQAAHSKRDILIDYVLRFFMIIFYVPKFAPNLLLQRLSCLNSVETETALGKLLFLGRLITEPEMAKFVRSLFMSRAESYFDANVTSMGVLPSIIEALN